MTSFNLKVATLNISGGQKTFEDFAHDSPQARQDALQHLVGQIEPDVLCLQEVSQFVDADGVSHNLVDNLKQPGKYEHFFYGKTVSMETHMQVKKDMMVEGIFNDWWNWSKGNAILSRIPFSRLSDPQRSGSPRSIPLYQPGIYEGTRDTEPRNAILARFRQLPYPFIATLHLTTLVGERRPRASRNKIGQSHLLRHQQIQRFLDLVRVHILQAEQPLILTGDFNATQDEFCIRKLLEADHQFVHLTSENDVPSHNKVSRPIDHIFFYPRQRLVDYSCRIVDEDLSRRASDHLPVVAELQIK